MEKLLGLQTGDVDVARVYDYVRSSSILIGLALRSRTSKKLGAFDEVISNVAIGH